MFFLKWLNCTIVHFQEKLCQEWFQKILRHRWANQQGPNHYRQLLVSDFLKLCQCRHRSVKVRIFQRVSFTIKVHIFCECQNNPVALKLVKVKASGDFVKLFGFPKKFEKENHNFIWSDLLGLKIFSIFAAFSVYMNFTFPKKGCKIDPELYSRVIFWPLRIGLDKVDPIIKAKTKKINFMMFYFELLSYY